MKIVIAGGSGFIGEPLVRRLLARGDDVAVLSRDPKKVDAGRGVAWDAKSQGPWTSEITDADVLINLAGDNIGKGRWTDAKKRRIVDSRVDATRALIEALRHAPKKERAFVSASAIGYYGSRGEEELDESSAPGSDFLAEVCKRWEAEARAAESLARLVVMRLGVVLASDGGALASMAMPFKFGGGGPVGDGRQWVSWVDREDVLRFLEKAVSEAGMRGTYNVVAPHPVRNRELARAIGSAMHRPALLPAPAFALKLALGEMAGPLLLASQRVLPSRLLAEGFAFQYHDVAASVASHLGKR
jgi:uncharacterized protein (TIGR01777 family)